jgi:WD40 repeat protein/class 3 adenylate cyclase
MLQIRLLGQFDLRLDGKRVAIPSRAGQSLFAYLALTAGTPHRREKLAGMLWADTTDEIARKNLRQELWRIRKALSGGEPAKADYLIADEFTLQFNRAAEYWLDAVQLERPDLDLQSLIANLSLYQGELLPGFYDEWVSLERERVDAVFEARMEQLLEQLITAERWIAVQEWGERWLTLSGPREPAFRALMLASGARGDMAKVSSLYQRCAKELMEQLGTEASAETQALYEGLLKESKTLQRAAAQPSATVTFLYTDIEGSTRLLERMGDQYAVALDEHHQILRAAIQKWNGREVTTQGDSFFITFTRAMDAVQCAAEVQRALLSQSWPSGESLRVRMGLHTGEPLIASTGYVGMDVHRAARIGDAGHGGQILLSQTTRELVAHDLPAGMALRDLGEHRLKDLKYPTTLYQLVVDGLPADFPAIRTKFTGVEAPSPGEAPFKGLEFFDVQDSDLFFGREALTDKLVDRLRGVDFLSVIIGASGSGKSSLVRAGLVPAINKTHATWRIHILTPTSHPLEALAIELTRDSESVTAAATLADDLSKDPRSLHLFLSRQTQTLGLSHMVLVVDQFEELFTLCRDAFEREVFIDNLLTALSPSPFQGEGRGEGCVTLIITLRADFYAHLAQYPELRDSVAQGQEYIGPMTSEELRRAIEEPARRGRWEFEPGLVDLILRDVGDEPGALPLLSHALLETWKRRAGHTLTLKGYADAGGVRGAIAHTAESLYQILSPAEQAITRDILLRLTEFGDGTEDTRRRASFEELMSHAADPDEVRAVLNSLAEARLVTLGEDSAEVAHEALIREWPQLREWLSQDREGHILHRRLTEAAHEWELLERDAGSVYRGARLAQANEWSVLNPGALNAQERLFLEASNQQAELEEHEREKQRERELAAAKELAETQRQSASRLRRRNRLITTVGSIAISLALLAVTLGVRSNQHAVTAETNAGLAEAARIRADEQRDLALRAEAAAQVERDRADQAAALSFSRELAVAAKFNLTVDPERSILLALAGLDQAHTQEAENVLHEAVLASRIRLTLRGHEDSIEDMTYSPDGKLIATASLDETARLWDATTGQELLRLVHPAGVGHVVFTPDGSRLATGAGDGLVRLWDVASGNELLTIPAAPKASREIWLAQFLDFSPDGSLLATTADYASEVKFWDPVSGDELFVISDPGWLSVAPGVDLVANQIKFSPNGTRLAISLGSGDAGLGRIEVWEVATRQKLQTMAGHFRFDPILPMDFSPDGTRLAATRGPDDRTTIWDAASGKLLFSLTLENSGNDVRYSTDGTRLLSGSPGGRVKVFDAETGDELLALVGHTGIINKVSERPGCVQPPVAPFEWCGTHLASASSDGTVRVWNISPTGSEELLTLPGSQFALNQDGTRLATVLIPPYNPEGTSLSIHAWDLPVGPRSVESSSHTSSSIEIGPGYQWTFLIPAGIQVAAFDNAPYKFWDVFEEGKAWYPISCCSWESGIDLYNSGRHEPRAAIGDPRTGKVMIWDLLDNEQLRTIQVGEPNEFQRVFLSPNGERLVILNFDTSLETWDVTTGHKLLTLPGPATVENSQLRFSPDEKWLAIGDCTGTVVVRDVASGEEKLRFSGTSACIHSFGFSPDGKLLAVNAGNRGLRILDFDTEQELLTLPGGFEVEFTPDGTRVITATRDERGQQIVRTYLLRLEDIVALAKSRVTRSLTTEECQQYLHVDECPAEP